VVGEQVAYVALPPAPCAELGLHNLGWRLAEWQANLPRRAAGGALIDYPWDLIEHNAKALEADFRHWMTMRESVAPPQGVVRVGPPERLLIAPTARVEPLALIDTSAGPVLLDEGAVVKAFSRLEGPCYVGAGTQVLSARIRGSSFGPRCKIGGEVEASIVQGHSNKAHDGFLGHSYLGEWVNLGAGSHTSDLRNDYGQIRVSLAGQRVESGQMKMGSFVGDHTKASLGCLFNTGSFIGPFAQLVTNGSLLPRSLPAFCQVSRGRVQERTDLRQMFHTAGTVMARRRQAWTDTHAEFFLDLYERTAGERRQLLREQLAAVAPSALHG
jgi:UDP-N-acetylglucosamine diphosphorylase/glucosamine-1-phosphate N-acetyltransferase